MRAWASPVDVTPVPLRFKGASEAEPHHVGTSSPGARARGRLRREWSPIAWVRNHDRARRRKGELQECVAPSCMRGPAWTAGKRTRGSWSSFTWITRWRSGTGDWSPWPQRSSQKIVSFKSGPSFPRCRLSAARALAFRAPPGRECYSTCSGFHKGLRFLLVGLDIYVGSLTRYLAHDWETVLQRWARETGTSYVLTRVDLEPGEPITDPQVILDAVTSWQTGLGVAARVASGQLPLCTAVLARAVAADDLPMFRATTLWGRSCLSARRCACATCCAKSMRRHMESAPRTQRSFTHLRVRLTTRRGSHSPSCSSCGRQRDAQLADANGLLSCARWVGAPAAL